MEIKKRVKKIEKSIADKVGGKRSICSGALWFQKSDVQTDKFQIEVKTTFARQDGIIVKKRWLDKIVKEARNTGRIPVLCCKTDLFEAYLIKAMYLNLYNKSYIKNMKCPIKISGKSYFVNDTDLLLDFNGDVWVVLSDNEFISFVDEVNRVNNN